MIVVCEQNFTQFAGSFAHRGLYQDITSNDNLMAEDGKDDEDEDYNPDEEEDDLMQLEDANAVKLTVVPIDIEEASIHNNILTAYHNAIGSDML